jgi:hypothetical protein
VSCAFNAPPHDSCLSRKRGQLLKRANLLGSEGSPRARFSGRLNRTPPSEVLPASPHPRPRRHPHLAGAFPCQRLRASATLDQQKPNRSPGLADHFLSGLMEGGTKFVAVNNPNAKKPTIHILASRRGRAGADQRPHQGRIGCRQGSWPTVRQPSLGRRLCERECSSSEAADAFAAEVLPIIHQIQASGITSRRGVAKALSERGVGTARSML